MERWSKSRLRNELLSQLNDQLAIAERAHQGSLEGATHEEARPENDKDTRALEQSYLARGQAQRIVELKEANIKVQAMPIQPLASDQGCTVGCVVELVDDNDHSSVYWIAPAGGGTRLAEGAVQVVTPQSPLGRALMGCRVDDDVEITLAGKPRILSVSALE